MKNITDISKYQVRLDQNKKALHHVSDEGFKFKVQRQLPLHILHHLPHAAGAYPRAESAADALAFIDNILEGLVRQLLAHDRSVVA